ncbi:LysR substrate-binding domain-containing protein [Paraburkholderia sp. RL17-337-BIB-A]|uniref:LysR substrate-binding domain-containing protein n=1 Tax=Paraburkholderia sp. RL17-337-BIB-A TaxID=3031636 RepID=UPI0038B85748
MSHTYRFVEHEVPRQLTVEPQLSRTIVSLFANGAGVALLDAVTAAYAGKDVAVRPFEPQLPDPVYLASAAAQSLSAVASTFVVRARKALGDLVA